ncbi:hypothetical protein NKJ35_25395 [Mesorhizobium sp. M0136]|uniref:hypothetical protein n=1 Tax=Mesorhizobium sp. M0136 TaxID=2956890 RepID=UPI0033387657
MSTRCSRRPASSNYAFERIALDANEASGENVRVGVIDTGIDDKNPALSGVIAGQFNAMPDVPIKARDRGTSVDGLIAGNLLHAAPDRSADWVEKALAGTARDLGPKGRDNDFGFGLWTPKRPRRPRNKSKAFCVVHAVLPKPLHNVGHQILGAKLNRPVYLK